MRTTEPLLTRLARHASVDPVTGCWNWTGARSGQGYGFIAIGSRNKYVHRISHELFVGPIPDGHEVHHKCENEPCFNPEHLQALTVPAHGQLTDRPNARKTHCPRGHEYTRQNTYFDKGASCRRCKACRNEKRREKQEQGPQG